MASAYETSHTVREGKDIIIMLSKDGFTPEEKVIVDEYDTVTQGYTDDQILKGESFESFKKVVDIQYDRYIR